MSYAQSTRQHDSHAHGIGELNVVVEGDELAIELISPAANIVGFEHAPSNDEQKAAVAQAKETLEQAEMLFVLSERAGCQAEHAHVESELLEGHEHEEHHDDEHAHEDEEHHDDEHAHEDEEHHDDEHAHEDEEHHDDEHAHEDEEHHDDEHAHEDEEHHDGEHADEHEHEEEVHSEFHVEYEFHCDDTEKLTEIQVKLFDTFPATEKLNVQLLTPDQQTAISLDKDNSSIEL